MRKLFYCISMLYVFNVQVYGQTATSDAIPPKDTLKKSWAGINLINDKKNAVIQRLSIVGRYHGQYWNVNAHQGNASGWDNRRFFVGVEAVLFQKFTAQFQIRISDDFKPLYNGLFQAFLKWVPNKNYTITLGRVDFMYAGFERTISSNRIVTIERSLLSNQLWPGEVVGAVVEAKYKDISYHVALLEGAKGDDIKESDYKRGFGVAAGVGYKAPLFYKSGTIHFNYLYNNGKSTINGFEPYNHSFSLWHQGQIGAFKMGVELAAAHGIDTNKSVMGITLLPSYVVCKNLLRKGDLLEAVLRYQYAVSDGDNGLRLQPRYERRVVTGVTGNAYQALYAGVNYQIINNLLKVITGIEYAAMKNDAIAQNSFKGWTYFAGVRVYF